MKFKYKGSEDFGWVCLIAAIASGLMGGHEKCLFFATVALIAMIKISFSIDKKRL